MRQIRYVNLGPRPTNLLVQVLGLVVGLVVLGVAVIVGGIVLAALIGLVLIAWIVISIRLWWLSRKTGKAGADEPVDGPVDGQVVEAEYRVIETTKADDDTP